MIPAGCRIDHEFNTDLARVTENQRRRDHVALGGRAGQTHEHHMHPSGFKVDDLARYYGHTDQRRILAMSFSKNVVCRVVEMAKGLRTPISFSGMFPSFDMVT